MPSDVDVFLSYHWRDHAQVEVLARQLCEQDLLCRVFGRCVAGDILDREVGDLIGKEGPVSSKLFTYMRYNAELSEQGLADLGSSDINPEDVQQLDSVKHIEKLQCVGQAVATRKMSPEHFNGSI